MEITETEARPKSAAIFQGACRFIPKGVNSPARAFFEMDLTPVVAEAGSEDQLIDADGCAYIDYCGSWGALIHGHAHPQIVEAATKRIRQGSTFGLTTAVEAKLAQKIVEHVPSIEQVRFVSSGTEATMSAIRLARGFTGRDLIIKFAGHYHGHADPFLVQAGSGLIGLTPTASSKGVPQDCIKHTLCLPYNDFEACEKAFEKYGKHIAAVIVEPIAANMGVVLPKEGFLQKLREATAAHQALLIFDEVITGFRVGLGGAQTLFGVDPDLSCLGKVIGGGFPAAAFGGKAEIMALLAPGGPVYQAGTLSGNPVSMEAGLKALELCEMPGFYQTLEAHTRLLIDPIQELIEKKRLNMCINQVGSLFTLFFGRREVSNVEEAKQCDVAQFKRFFQALLEKGIYLSPSQFEAHFVSAAHRLENLTYTRDAMLEVLSAI